ncbi:hypothetical protein MTO96_045291 [Rhipicephalus appendiculatus]
MEARKASRRLQVTWSLNPEDPRITYGDATLTSRQRCRVMRSIREVLAAPRDQALQDLPNQGKVMACVGLDPASSHFLRKGTYTHFADWRFIHRARLNLLPLNGAVMWAAPDRDQRCRTCGFPRETLPHVMCHCMARSALYNARHDAVVERLRDAAAARFTVAYQNRPVGDTTLRPDLVLVSGEEALVVDVACPFDNTPTAFANARNEKLQKYEPVAAYLRRRYQRVTVAAVVVGALGAWDPANDATLRRPCARSYLRVLKRLCVSDVIAASRAVYHAHAPVLVTAPPPGPTRRRLALLLPVHPGFLGPAARDHLPDDAPTSSHPGPDGPGSFPALAWVLADQPVGPTSSRCLAPGLAGSTATSAASPGVIHPLAPPALELQRRGPSRRRRLGRPTSPASSGDTSVTGPAAPSASPSSAAHNSSGHPQGLSSCPLALEMF